MSSRSPETVNTPKRRHALERGEVTYQMIGGDVHADLACGGANKINRALRRLHLPTIVLVGARLGWRQKSGKNRRSGLLSSDRPFSRAVRAPKRARELLHVLPCLPQPAYHFLHVLDPAKEYQHGRLTVRETAEPIRQFRWPGSSVVVLPCARRMPSSRKSPPDVVDRLGQQVSVSPRAGPAPLRSTQIARRGPRKWPSAP